jgi:hypothetical protein
MTIATSRGMTIKTSRGMTIKTGRGMTIKTSRGMTIKTGRGMTIEGAAHEPVIKPRMADTGGPVIVHSNMACGLEIRS